MTKGYKFQAVTTALGTSYEFEGPGMPQYANGAHLLSKREAETVARLLALAFEAGKRMKAEEIRIVLGVRS